MLTQSYRQVLGSLWTAGYRPSLKERIALQHAPGANRVCFTQRENDENAREILHSFGYSPNEKGTGLQILDMLADRTGPRANDTRPLPGHLIETNGLWSVPEVRLSGYYDDPQFTSRIGNRIGSWIGTIDAMCFSLGSGGPASILAVDLDHLEPTGRTAVLSQWDFPMLPAPNTAVTWLVEVPIWSATKLQFAGFPIEDLAA